MALNLAYRAIRPLAWVAFFIGYLLGVGCGNATLNPKAWLGCLAMAFGCISGMVMNNYADRNLDKKAVGKDINLRKNPWATGELDLQDMLALAISPTIVMVILCYLISPLFLILTIISWVAGSIGYSYPLYLKGKAPWDILCMPIATYLFPFLAGYWLNTMLPFPTLPIILSFTFGIDIFIASEVWDIDADKAAGLKTTAVTLGKEKSEYTRLILKVLQVAFAMMVCLLCPPKWQVYALGMLGTSLIPSYEHLKLQWISFVIFVIGVLIMGAL